MALSAAPSASLRAALVEEAADWAIGNGLVVRASAASAEENDATPLATHAPLSLLPSPFPRSAFEHARALQPHFNRLVHAISRDHAFLDDVVSSLAGVDEFTGSLYRIFKDAEAAPGPRQTAVLGLHRSDYLLHTPTEGATPVLQQVELNTIAASFSSLSAKAGDLHRYLLGSVHLERADLIGSLPENRSGTALADGIAAAWKLYGQSKAVVVMVVQPKERNAFDQRWIHYRLMREHGIAVLRCTLSDIAAHGRLDPSTNTLFVHDREVAVAYFRAGYGPGDYPTDQEWAARRQIEVSMAIKCPTVAYQLAGTKKVQQVVALPGVLERFLPPADAAFVRTCFTGLFPLDGSPEGNTALAAALDHPNAFVLKPQREGGGNNYYNADVARMLRALSADERRAYILMDRILPPASTGLMLRRGVLTELATVSELGIYGVFLSQGDAIVLNEDAGHLLRTKGATVDEGGVAAGYAHIDSPLLV